MLDGLEAVELKFSETINKNIFRIDAEHYKLVYLKMKHILEKKISEATSLELLLVLMHTEGISDGPMRIVYAEPVIETIIGICSDATARILVFKDDLEALVALCGEEITVAELDLYGKELGKVYPGEI